jgi:hypothetical protein
VDGWTNLRSRLDSYRIPRLKLQSLGPKCTYFLLCTATEPLLPQEKLLSKRPEIDRPDIATDRRALQTDRRTVQSATKHATEVSTETHHLHDHLPSWLPAGWHPRMSSQAGRACVIAPKTRGAPIAVEGQEHNVSCL